jgi:hypothetical protein
MLAHSGVQNLRRSSNSSLSIFARAKSAPGECHGGGGGASRRWGSILDFCVLSAHPATWLGPNKRREQALRCTELSHRMPGYTTAQRTIFPYIVALGPRLAD